MRSLRLACLVMPALVVSLAAADVSGTWELSLKADWTRIPELVCTFSQKYERLSGSCNAAGEPPEQKVDLTGGTVEGNRISCQWSVVTPDRETWTYALTGTLDENGTMITGDFKLSSRASESGGSWTAKKQ